MATANLPVGNVYYECLGESNKPAIILIGGFGGDHHVWSQVAPILAESYYVISFDNPGGKGLSFMPDNNFVTIKNYADLVIELCDFLNIQQAYFIGSSMGGTIVQQLAHDYADRVLKAVICNSYMQASRVAYLKYAETALEWFDSNLSKESIIKAVLAWLFSGKFLTPENISAMVQAELNNPKQQLKAGYEKQLQAVLAFDSSKWLSDIKTQCLFIACDEDAICFSGQVREMANLVEKSEFYEFQNSVGHLPHIEQPELFVEIVRKYLITPQDS